MKIKKISNEDISQDLAHRYSQHKTKEATQSLEAFSIIAEAKDRLSKKSFWQWLKDSRVNLKPTQARKMIAIDVISKAGVQAPELLQKHGIEKTFLISQIDSDELKKEIINFLLSNHISLRVFKKAIDIAHLEELNLNDALDRAKLKKQPVEKKENSEVEQLKKIIEELNNQVKLMKEELLKYKQKPTKPVLTKEQKKTTIYNSDHVQPQLALESV